VPAWQEAEPETDSRQEAMDYRREIDGLRALAVLPVILFHAGFETFSGGFVGVDVFFVISGYLITTIILAELEQGKFSIVNFYERRARRILPALFLVMLVCIPFAWFFLFPQDLLSFSKSLVSVSLFLSNVFFWSKRGYFGEATELKPLIHTWSLSVEEQYYLFFPLLLMLFERRVILRNRLLFALFVCSFALCVWLSAVHQDSAFFLLPTRFWELLVGSFVAIYLFKNSKSCQPNEIKEEFFGALGILLILYSVFFFDKSTSFPSYFALVPVLGTALVIVFAKESSYAGKILGFKGVVFVGLLSYSAYLWHQPIFAFARHAYSELSFNFLVSLIALTFVFSYISWRYVEQPCRKNSYRSKVVFLSSAVGLIFFSFVGFYGIFNKGFVERYSKEDVLVLNNFINADDYVLNRFDSRKLVDFDLSDSKRRKVLVIGDSYGKDLVNAIYESSLIDAVQISTHQINSECGNLYLEEDFTKEIDSKKLPRCQVLGWYENDSLKRLIRQADYIWLASSWSMWVAERLPRSIDNLERDFGKPVFVFSTKNFGRINLKNLLLVPIEDRYSYVAEISNDSYAVQQFMRESLADYKFVDIGTAMCRSDNLRCRLFNDNGEPLSYDGAHLTRAGSKFLGEVLLLNEKIKSELR
jgi:peptidoglycan/LPS O-acetylase OafA/YrhL